MGVILTTFPADGDAVRAVLGVEAKNFSDTQIQTDGYLGAAEAYITRKVTAQSGNGVPSVTTIMASSSDNKTFLRAAVIYYLAYQFANAETNAVDTSGAVGPVQKSLGGIGAQWKEQGVNYLKLSTLYLRKLTGWKHYRTL